MIQIRIHKPYRVDIICDKVYENNLAEKDALVIMKSFEPNVEFSVVSIIVDKQANKTYVTLEGN